MPLDVINLLRQDGPCRVYSPLVFLFSIPVDFNLIRAMIELVVEGGRFWS